MHKQSFDQKTEVKKNKGHFREIIAKLSRGIMLPVAMLPIAGLFLGLGATISNLTDSSVASNLTALNIFGKIFSIPGNLIFSSLPILFAIAIAISFTKDSGTAGMSAVVGWLIFNGIQSVFIQGHDHYLFYNFGTLLSGTPSEDVFSALFTQNIGIPSLNTSVFGGIIVGAIVAFLYNKFKNIQLPPVIGFFSGVRFIPIITFISMLVLGVLFALVWPAIGVGLFLLGKGISAAPYGINSFIFGMVERSLVPFGLHHAFYAPLWFTSAGGMVTLDTNMLWDGNSVNVTWRTVSGITDTSIRAYNGDQNIWMFINNYIIGKTVTFQVDGVQHTETITFENVWHLLQTNNAYGNPGQYMQGKYPFMIFGLPAAALAMILVVPKGTENREQAIAIIGSSALTCMLTGITEPLEFTFLFLAPWLFWGIHAPLCAISFWLMNILGAHVGQTFSAGLLDFVIYGVLPDVNKAHADCYWIPVVGLSLVPIYYFLFRTLILKFDIKTPGRGTQVKMFTKEDYKTQQQTSTGQVLASVSTHHKDKYQLLAVEVIAAYGGKENIKNVDACITKLRVQVADQSKVDKDLLMKLGAHGVIKPSPHSVYAVFGNEADIIKNRMNDILFKGE